MSFRDMCRCILLSSGFRTRLAVSSCFQSQSVFSSNSQQSVFIKKKKKKKKNSGTKNISLGCVLDEDHNMTTTQRAVRKQTASTYLQFIRATQHVAFHSGWTKTRTHTQIYFSSVLIYLCTNLIIEALDILYPHVWWWSCFVIFSTKVLFLKQVIKFQDVSPVLKIVGKVKEKRQKVRLLLTEREMQFWWKPFKGILISNDW